MRIGADGRSSAAAVVRDDRQLLVELEITPGRANRARVNRSPVPRPREVLGILRTVLFAPEDLALVKGDPAERRRFLDDLLVAARRRGCAGVRADYDRVLKQRNTLLEVGRRRPRGARRRPAHARGLGPAPRPARGRAARRAARTGRRAAPAGRQGVRDVAGAGHRGPEVARWTTAARVELRLTADGTSRRQLAERLLTAALADAPRRRSSSAASRLVGPHRDDLRAQARPAAGQGLREPRRVLVVRAGAAAGGVRPAARAERRRAGAGPRRRLRRAGHRPPGALAELVAGAEQVLVTAAVPDDVPEALAGARYDVADGEVERAE